MRALRFLTAGLLLLAPVAASAAPHQAPVSITRAWVQAPLKGSPATAAYLTIRNNTRRPERLLGASSPAAEAVTLHSMSTAGGVMRMRRLDEGLTIAPGATVALEPGGDHLMMTGPKRTLTPGDRVPITLRFQNAGETTLDIPVQRAAPSR